MHRPAPDLLRFPGLGRFLLWKHSRTAIQTVLFFVAAGMIVDGLLGTPLAAKNAATVTAWVHYRGLIVLLLLVVGNLFCAACPFVLPRKLAKWIGRPTQRWPRPLRNKWLALAGFVLIIYAYELFDLWASPWWTAWLILAYFGAAFVLEAFFTRNSFCLYVCPLGTFNFLYSTVSPTQIAARDLQVCSTCVGKDCINGNSVQQGCQLELYVPTLKSNWDCTLCLDCAKACPHDNVALTLRPHGRELSHQSWPNRLDLALLSVVAAALGLINAFAMTPPVYSLEIWLAQRLNIASESLILALIFLVGALLVPLALVWGAAWVSRHFSSEPTQLSRLVLRHAYAFVPLGFAIWFAHYLFHFLTGALTILPAWQTFFADTVGVPLLGAPDWQVAQRLVPPVRVIQALQIGIMLVGYGSAAWLTIHAVQKEQPEERRLMGQTIPWLVVLLLFSAAAIAVFLLPMEMRGSAFGG